MTTVMKAGAMPDHRERFSAGRARGTSFTMPGDDLASATIAPAKPSVRTPPTREPISDLSRPTRSAALKRSLDESTKRERLKRDHARQQAIARLRAIQQRD